MQIGRFKGKKLRDKIWYFDIPHFKNEERILQLWDRFQIWFAQEVKTDKAYSNIELSSMMQEQFVKMFGHTFEVNPDWLEFRLHTIGASEVCAVMQPNLDPRYYPKIETWYNKIGYPQGKIQNEYMYWGQQIEDKIGDAWQYYDGTEQGYVQQYAIGEKKRSCKRLPYFIVNEDYPWLSASLDFLADAGQYSPFLEKVVDFDFPLETKQLSYFACEMFEDGFPPRYIAQLHQQMLIWMVGYSEFGILKDGNKFEVRPMIMSEVFRDKLIDDSFNFWYGEVLPGKELYAEYLKTRDESIMSQIQAMEPPPEQESNEGYEAFMKERYKVSYESKSFEGDQTAWEHVINYDEARKMEKEGKEAKQQAKNELLHIMKDAEEMTFEDGSKVTWRRQEGKRDYFNVKLK